MCVYTHISDGVEIVCALPLLQNNTASETFLHKSGTVRSVDWMFIIEAPAWRLLGEYVTVDKTFYSSFKTELIVVVVIVVAPVNSTVFPFRIPRGGLY